ncbi:NACHT domain-containing protein [Fusarium falciforme]|uniref:NACHT domain-containing protein n=1 Tax=Fusarium falciforme TaxID=195108 RepID=UPI0022FFE67B|nr:NACHT domain-containing protein [Fusarium falciforme]WAO94531.1 NACHT domain-containing protein [Fusarium falciforme]
MEGLGVAANVIAVIDLTAKATSACAAYLKAVKNAKTDIERLQSELRNLDAILHGAARLVKGHDGSKLQTMGQLKGALSDASSQLQQLIVKLEDKQGKTRKAMSHFGFRALKWPFESAEVASIIQDMERNRSNISAALVIDNTALQVETHSTVQEISSNVQHINRILDMSKIPVAKGAAFDSHTNEHDPKCLPNTRVELQQTITAWAEDTRSDTIFWLNGMAGTGKSTISRTIAHSFAQKKMLGASFFFKRGERDRGTASRLFTTIAAQLINRLPEIGPLVIKAVENEPDLPNKFIQEQFEKLILNPLHGVSASGVLVLVIDALDECDRVADVRLIVNILARLKSLNRIKLKAFVTSRPELPIRLGFNTIQGEYKDLVLHEIPKPVIEHDISEFLHHQLEQARLEYNSQSDPNDQLGPDWPGTQTTDALIQMAVPLFIFAATMCRFIQDPLYDPVTQLEKVLKYKSSAQDSEMAKLDTTYRPTLDQLLVDRTGRARERVLKDFRDVVGTIVLLQEPLSISTLSCLADIPERVISGILRPLHSVLSVPISPREPIRMLHLSFHDFLVDKEMHETDPFWVDDQETHERIVTRCLDLLRSGKHLKQDICDLGLPGTRRADIEQRQVNLKLPGEVRYACLYWTHHLEGSGLKLDDSHPAFSFLKDYFLFWLEALAILGEVHNCSAMIASIQSLADPKHGTGLSNFLREATRFVTRLDTIIDKYPLQIYASGLVFAPEKSIVKTAFRKFIPEWIRELPQTPQNWDASLRVIETSLNIESAMCFLPDSRSLQIFSKGGVVQIWDTMTGKQLDSIEADGEYQMRFSLDGECSLSTNHTSSIVFWGSLTGGSQHRSEQRILDIALSPDGKVAACTLRDGRVLVLDRREGQVRQRFYGQDGGWMRRTNTALSRDRLAIAGNMKMQLWDLNSEGEPLDFQVDPSISGVCFSPDGRLIAYAHGSRAAVHDARTGKLLQTLGPCTEDISVIAFAPDGRHLALASGRRIHLWHHAPDKEVNRFKHPYRVGNMAFSPDGGLLAVSSPLDNMIQIWHPTAQHDADGFKEHDGGHIAQLALSRDREQVAALLEDNSVQIWDIDTARSIKTIAYPVYDGIIINKEEKSAVHPASDVVIQVSFSQTQQQNLVWAVSRMGITSMSEEKSFTDHLYNKQDGLAYKAVFSPDGNMVALSYPYKIRIWDLLARKTRHTLTAEKMNNVAFGFSPDSKVLVSMIASEDVIIWDLTSGRIKQSLSVRHDGQERHSVVALSLHDSTLALARSSGADFWDINTGACLSTIRVDGSLSCISFDTTGTRLVTERGDIKLPPLHCHDSDEAVPFVGFEGYGLTGDFTWLTWKSRPIIWLPPSYRPSFRTQRVGFFIGSTVILGTVSGSISIFKFAETPPWETQERPGSQSPSG